MPSILSTTANVITIDLAQANVASLSAASAANVSGDSYAVNLPGKVGSASVVISNSAVTATLGSTLLTIAITAVQAGNVNVGSQQSIDVLLTRSSTTYGFQFSQALNVITQANP